MGNYRERERKSLDLVSAGTQLESIDTDDTQTHTHGTVEENFCVHADERQANTRREFQLILTAGRARVGACSDELYNVNVSLHSHSAHSSVDSLMATCVDNRRQLVCLFFYFLFVLLLRSLSFRSDPLASTLSTLQ